jgi:hypothetical protein
LYLIYGQQRKEGNPRSTKGKQQRHGRPSYHTSIYCYHHLDRHLLLLIAYSAFATTTTLTAIHRRVSHPPLNLEAGISVQSTLTNASINRFERRGPSCLFHPTHLQSHILHRTFKTTWTPDLDFRARVSSHQSSTSLVCVRAQTLLK